MAARAGDGLKSRRQRCILEIVHRSVIETQDQLVEALRGAGFSATQATVSRDIRELGLVRTPMPDGRLRYALPQADPTPSDRLMEIFRASVLEVDFSGNTVVLHTLPATAAAVAEAVDSLRMDGVIGSLAGERTVFLVVKPPEDSARVAGQLRSMIG
jgi:transcriptional regulator of arginine metabolism